MNRYHLLLVEDEDIIRQGLYHMIEKMDLNLQVTQASDGVEAMEICTAQRVDILLTDISMPRMDGLSLIASLREQGSDMPCMIISGYSEFDYARRAIRYGVEDYILKPIERGELRSALEKVVQELEESGKADSIPEENERQARARMEHDVWARVFADEHVHLSEEERRLVSRIDFSRDALVLLGMYKPGGALYEALLKLEAQYGRVLCNYRSSGGYLFHLLEVGRGDVPALTRAYTGLEKGDAAMASVLSPACLSLWEVSVSYRMCTNGLNARLIHPIPCVQLAKGGETASHEVPSHYFESLRNALEMREGAHAGAALHQLLEHLLSDPNMTPELLIECMQNLELFLLSSQSGQMIRLIPARSRLSSLDYLLSSSDTMESFEEAVFLRIQFISGILNVNTASSPIGIVLDYIDKHYSQDISAVYCSNLISMNSSYFSTYFKKKTGLSFVNYLHQLRARKSAELLRRTDLRVYEIAQQVGFPDDKYFFKVFKQYYGVTPSEFRNLPDADRERLNHGMAQTLPK